MNEAESEPELISIIEGPTPDFMPTGHETLHSIYEGPLELATAVCELRTNTGAAIIDRCTEAWEEHRPVKLEFPDANRTSQRIGVVSMQLREREEGEVLMLWVISPVQPFFLSKEDADSMDGFDLSDFDFDDDPLF